MISGIWGLEILLVSGIFPIYKLFISVLTIMLELAGISGILQEKGEETLF